MEVIHLRESELLPQILLARYYDTALFHAGKTRERIATYYETSIYLSDCSGAVTINGMRYHLHRGDVRFVRPGDTICSEPSFACFTVNFHFGSEEVLYRNPILDKIPSFFHLSKNSIPMFEEIVNLYTENVPGNILRQNAMLMELLLCFYRNTFARFSPAVNLCVTHMEEHFSEPVTLEQLGQLTGYSPLHLLRIFKAETGETPHEFLTRQRLSHAKKMLINTNIPITELAADCGFHSESHFKALFKSNVGDTPGRYRKKANQDI